MMQMAASPRISTRLRFSITFSGILLHLFRCICWCYFYCYVVLYYISNCKSCQTCLNSLSKKAMASSQFSHRFRQFRNNHLKPPACIRMRGRRSHDKVLWSTVSYLRSTFTATVSADIFVRVEPGAVMSKFSVGLVNLKASSTAYKNIEPEEESLLMMANPAPPSCRVPVAPRISSLFADICAGKVQTLSAGSIHGDSGTP